MNHLLTLPEIRAYRVVWVRETRNNVHSDISGKKSLFIPASILRCLMAKFFSQVWQSEF